MKRIQNTLDPNNLKNHLLNIELYSDKPDPEFVELVRENGVTEPIMVTQENVIISGHRRNQAAKMCGLKEVPVVIVDLKDELDIQKMLVICNKQREKTKEIRAREYKILKEIEEKQAKLRLKTSTGGKEPRPKENLPEAEKHSEKQGQSRDLAAKEVGLSGKTAEDAAKVVEEIDRLEAEGDTEGAEALREELNNKSVSSAARKAGAKKDKPKEFKEKTIDDLFGKLVRAVDARYEAKNGRAEQGECLKHLKAFDKALKAWRAK